MSNLIVKFSRSDRRSQLPISGPSDFIHVVHMGPSQVQDLQNSLIDIQPSPNTSSPHNSQTDKVKSMMVNPVMRSASTSAASPHTFAGFQQQHQSRPMSSHSRGSEGIKISQI